MNMKTSEVLMRKMSEEDQELERTVSKYNAMREVTPLLCVG